MKRQSVITQAICQTEIPALLDSWATNTLSVKMLCPQKNCLSLYFCKNITCLSVGLLRMGQVSSVSGKISLSTGYNKSLFQERYISNIYLQLKNQLKLNVQFRLKIYLTLAFVCDKCESAFHELHSFGQFISSTQEAQHAYLV